MGKRQRLRVDDIEAEIAALSKALGGLVARPPSEPPTEAEVWHIYAGAEKAVARLRYRLGTERPGVFSELPRSKRPGELLAGSLEGMMKASAEIGAGNHEDGLGSLRAARTFLRAYLADLLRIRMREKRKAALSRRSSSPSS